jgi:hypothetical protein
LFPEWPQQAPVRAQKAQRRLLSLPISEGIDAAGSHRKHSPCLEGRARRRRWYCESCVTSESGAM